MKTLKKYIYAIAFSLSLFSCDSFLTTPPLDQISEDQWWNDKSQTEMMVKGAYQVYLWYGRSCISGLFQ